jgi:hypothetical protein
MADKLPVTIKPVVGGYYTAMIGSVTPLWDSGTLDFALLCARSYLSGKTVTEITGRNILTINPRTYEA